jgi:predicted RNA-binding protein with PUA-like domain
LFKNMAHYWLIKSEASCYSIDDIKKDKRTLWTGVRNYQARNFLREMQEGDKALFYHSSDEPTGVVGVVEISKSAVADPTAFDKKDDHFDPKSTKENPIWLAPEVTFAEKFDRVVSLAEIKIRPDLEGIAVAQKGSRLSVMPVSEAHFGAITRLGKAIAE